MSTTIEEIIAVEFVNREKNIINFVKDETMHGFFHFNPTVIKPRIGDVFKVKFEKSKDNKFYKTISIRPAEPDVICPAIRAFNGKIEIANKNGFGFVEDIFIFPQMVKKMGLINGQEVVGRAVLSFDKKKSTWGWTVFKLIL